MIYTILFKPSAEKELRTLDKPLIHSINITLRKFANGEKCDSKKLKGFSNRYRVRAHDYRAIFDIIIEDNIMSVIRIAHRNKVYNNINNI